MLQDFITARRQQLIERCRENIADRTAPRATESELEHGVPMFLDQLAETLRHAENGEKLAIRRTASQHGSELSHRGFTIAQVVHDYGRICQAITELAIETNAAITTPEFKTLNACLDDAIADAVTEHARLHEYAGAERLGHLAHELRNLLNTAVLAFDMLKSGAVGVGGSTGAILGRSLTGLRNLVDRELAEVRLTAGVHNPELIVVRDLVEDAEVAAMMEAKSRGLQLSVTSITEEVTVRGDRQNLASVLANLLQNAFKFTRTARHVGLRVHANAERVFIEVHDECGGVLDGDLEALFLPFEQRGPNRSGLGLGLSMCRRAARLNQGDVRVVNLPGQGCVFTLDLPRGPDLGPRNVRASA